MTDTMAETLVRDSEAPLAAMELPSGRFLAVNAALAKALRSPAGALTRPSRPELMELPSGRFLAVNAALAKALGSTAGALTGSSSLELMAPGERHSAELGFRA